MSTRLARIALTFASTLAVALPLALVGCGPDTTQGVHPQLVPPLDTTDFGPVPVLNQKTMNLDVQNVGKGLLTIESAVINESDVPFQIVSQPEELGPAESQPIVVAFTPPEEKDYSATLTLKTDDQEQPEVTVNLVGKGSTRATMEVEPAMLDFGRVAEGQSAVKTVTVRSTGTADLIVEKIFFEDGSSDAFSFLGSVKENTTVPHTQENGLPGEIKITVRYTVQPGAPDLNTAVLHLQGTDPDHRDVLIPIQGEVNRAPIAVIAPLGVGSPGMEVTLDGSMSSDPDNDTPLTYKWVLRDKPLSSPTVIEDDNAEVTRMVLDPKNAGSYEVELQVTDAQGAKNLTATRATIVAAPAEKLLIEMFWDNQKTDIDLHLLQTPTAPFGQAPGDCFFQNVAPDWGMTGDTSDDPLFKQDALVGYGPEIVGYKNPAEGKFRVEAYYQSTHQAANPASAVTIRIYEYGVVKFEGTHTLLNAGEVWPAADIEWPSGTITPLSQ